jgi:hypothetical protein
MPQRPLKMTTARAEKLFSIDIVDAPPPLRVEATDQPPLAAIAPDPPVARRTAVTAVTAHSRRRACRFGARGCDRPGPERQAAHGKLQEAASARSASGRARDPSLRPPPPSANQLQDDVAA